MRKLIFSLLLITSVTIVGCLPGGDDSDDDSSGSEGLSTFTINLICSETDSDRCVVSNNGDNGYMTIVNNCTDMDEEVNLDAAVSVTCTDDTTDNCTLSLDQNDNWGDDVEAGTHNFAWFIDIDGSGSDPASGDVVCCDSGTLSEGGTLNLSTSNCANE